MGSPATQSRAPGMSIGISDGMARLLENHRSPVRDIEGGRKGVERKRFTFSFDDTSEGLQVPHLGDRHARQRKAWSVSNYPVEKLS